MKLETSHVVRPCKGEERSGDAVVVRTEAEGSLLAVVDVLGHGAVAADAARRASRFLKGVDLSRGVRAVVYGLHDELRATRGAAATVCLFRGGTLEAAGVGNVGLRSFGMSVGLVLTRGILGSRLRNLHEFQGVIDRNTRLVLFSDGIRPTFEREEATSGSPASACNRLLARYGRDTDDATVLVADASFAPEARS